MCVWKAEAGTCKQGEIKNNFLDTQGRIRKVKEKLDSKSLKDIKGNRRGFAATAATKGRAVRTWASMAGDQVMESVGKDNLW